MLADRSLLSAYRADSDVVVLHDVFRAYLRGLVAQMLPDLHLSLLDSLRPTVGWADLPRSRTYEWTYLAYHLTESGDVQEVADVLGDARYVIGKAAVCGAHTLRADRDLVGEVQAAMTGAEGTAGLDRAFQMTSLGYLLHGQHAELGSPSGARTELSACMTRRMALRHRYFRPGPAGCGRSPLLDHTYPQRAAMAASGSGGAPNRSWS